MRFESTVRSTGHGPASLPAKLSRNRKRVASFVGLLVIGSLLLSSLNRFLPAAMAAFAQAAGFFLLGYLHFLILRANVNGLSTTEKLLYSFLLAAVALVAASAFYFLLPAAHSWSTAAIGVCAFLLPYVLAEAWRAFYLLSTQAAATWRYSADVSLQKATTFLNSIPVRFRIQASRFDGEYTVSFRAPVRMKLGIIFYHMVQEQNNREKEAIRLLDVEEQPYEWAFSTSVLGWKNFLDPELTLLENGVKENAIVTAQRVSNQEAVEETVFEGRQANDEDVVTQD